MCVEKHERVMEGVWQKHERVMEGVWRNMRG